jgi:hypothetical protein
MYVPKKEEKVCFCLLLALMLFYFPLASLHLTLVDL